MKEFRLRVRKMVLETLLYEDEFRVEQEKKEAGEALFAFMQGKTKVNKVEDTKAAELSDALDKNDFHHQGYTHVEEEPIISITFNHKDYSISTSIDKEYFYRTEDSTRDYPGHEEMKLKNISITSPQILVYNQFGSEYSFNSSQLGADNFKHMGKVLMNYIQ